ncbi:MAG: hypothetical protein WCK89_12470, partial [bacterium]
ITPGEQAYVEGAEIAYQLAGGQWGMVKRTIQKRVTALANAGPLLIFIALVFLAVFGVSYTTAKKGGRKPPTSGPVIGVWFCGYLAVACYLTSLAGAQDDCGGSFFVAALLAQTVGIGLALVFQPHDPAARRRQIKWMLAPLWIVLGLVFLSGLFDAIFWLRPRLH